MEIKPYSNAWYAQCVDIFLSNQDLYFADDELDQYKTFLQKHAEQSAYFVLLEEGKIVGCGGYENYDGKMGLTWGMVKRAYHGQGYGKQLTIYRLNEIKAKFPNKKIVIDTSQHSKGFYEKQGFKIDAIEKDGFAPGLDKYLMTYWPIKQP